MVFEAKDQCPSQWSAIDFIAGKIGCTAETLPRWVHQAERDQALREGPTTTEQRRVKELEREVRELRKANEILKLASAFSPSRSSTAASDRELDAQWLRAGRPGAGPVHTTAAARRCPRPSLGSRVAIRVHPVHRAAGRGRHRGVGRLAW